MKLYPLGIEYFSLSTLVVNDGLYIITITYLLKREL